MSTKAAPTHPPNIKAKAKTKTDFGEVGAMLMVARVSGSATKCRPSEVNINFWSSAEINFAKASRCSRDRDVNILDW